MVGSFNEKDIIDGFDFDNVCKCPDFPTLGAEMTWQIFIVLNLYWIIYYRVETIHDIHIFTAEHVLKRGITKDKKFWLAQSFPHEKGWHTWDTWEKLLTMLVTTWFVAMLTNWMFAILCLYNAAAWRLLLHTYWIGKNSGRPHPLIYVSDTNTNFWDPWLRNIRDYFGDVAIWIIQLFPIISSEALLILYIFRG